MKISYLITCKDESLELQKLLRFLKENIRRDDEVIIQIDSKGYTNEVLEVANLFTNFNHKDCLEFHAIPHSKYTFCSLNNDFASFKNYIRSYVSKDTTHLFYLDADEIPTKYLIDNLPQVLESNSDIDMFYVNRENYVKGITEAHLKKWNWSQDEKGRLNFPDSQSRILKNIPSILYQGKVHEHLVGFKNFSILPSESEWCLIHKKDISKQEKQNEFYNTI